MLAVLLAGQFMALLDVTIVNVAMPTIGRTLHASGAELQLVVSGYTVSYAMLLITGARLGDLAGRRRMFLAGIALFTLSSAVCGFAPGIIVLIIARFAQGAGAAATMPQIISVIQARLAGRARATALSAYSAVLASGFVVGQVFGGLLVNANLFGSQWRPVFLVNVPIGLAVLCLAPRVVPRDARAGGRRLDLAGLAIAGPAVFAIVLPLMLGHQEGWPPWILACIAAGIVLAAVFVLVERRIAGRAGDPLLNLRVLRAPGLGSGLAAVAILMVSYGGFLFTLALQLQDGLGESALRAGLTFAPSALAFGLCGFYWSRLPARVHHLLTRRLRGGDGRLRSARPGPVVWYPGRPATAGHPSRAGRIAGPRVQPAGDPCATARTGAGGRRRQRAVHHNRAAGPGDRRGGIRQRVPDPGRASGAARLGARAGHHPLLAGRPAGHRHTRRPAPRPQHRKSTSGIGARGHRAPRC